MSKRLGPAPPALLHPEQLRLRQLEIYYSVLSEEPGFAKNLDHLYAIVNAPESVIVRALVRFSEQWQLPSSGPSDVLWTLQLKEEMADDEKVLHELVPCPRLVTSYPSVVELARAIADPEPGATAEGAWRRAQADVKAELRRRGFKPAPPRHHDEQEMRVLARRVVRRVMHRTSWLKIADAEHRDTGRYPDVRAVQLSVQQWAKALGIRLPEVPGGRPKNEAARNTR